MEPVGEAVFVDQNREHKQGHGSGGPEYCEDRCRISEFPDCFC